jgi:hypothetical protein
MNENSEYLPFGRETSYGSAAVGVESADASSCVRKVFKQQQPQS